MCQHFASNNPILWDNQNNISSKDSTSTDTPLTWLRGPNLLAHSSLFRQKRLHRYGSCPSPNCPQCSTHPETDIHFLQCGGPSTWRTGLFDPLEQLCIQKQVTHWVATGITRNLRKTLNNQDTVLVNPWIDEVIKAQQMIGWQSCFYGLFSKQWVEKHDQAMSTQTGAKLLTKIIPLVMVAVIDRWNTRSQTLHNTDQENTSEGRKRLLTQLEALYSCYHDLLPGDRQLFQVPLVEMCRKTNRQIQTFIQQTSPLVKESTKQQKARLQKQHLDISTYFTRPSTSLSTSPTRVAISH